MGALGIRASELPTPEGSLQEKSRKGDAWLAAAEFYMTSETQAPPPAELQQQERP